MAKRTTLGRLLRVAAVTVVVCLGAGAALWYVIPRYFPGVASGGQGTTVLARDSYGNSDVRVLPADISRAQTPLAKLLPRGWKRAPRKIAIEKSKRTLSVYSGEKRLKTYFVALGASPEGPKTRRDDGRTPEGAFYVCGKNPQSSYELSVLISYPDQKSAKDGLKEGIINKPIHDKVVEAQRRQGVPPQDTRLGGSIYIHGGGIGMISRDLTHAIVEDWTLGCIAMRSEDIREVYRFASIGTTVVIRK